MAIITISLICSWKLHRTTNNQFNYHLFPIITSHHHGLYSWRMAKDFWGKFWEGVGFRRQELAQIHLSVLPQIFLFGKISISWKNRHYTIYIHSWSPPHHHHHTTPPWWYVELAGWESVCLRDWRDGAGCDRDWTDCGPPVLSVYWAGDETPPVGGPEGSQSHREVQQWLLPSPPPGFHGGCREGITSKYL